MPDEEKQIGDGLFSLSRTTNKDVTNMFAPNPELIEKEEPKTDKQPTVSKKNPPQSTQINLTFDLPPARPARRRRASEKTYAEKHVTISLNVDARIASDVQDFLERGAIQSGNKTVFCSQLFLQLLINAGYEIDPNILAKPQ